MLSPWVAASLDALSEDTYKQLARVHELMQRQDYAQALSRLETLRPRVTHAKFETAMVLQTFAYLYTHMERYAEAIAAIEESLALQSLPGEAIHELHYLSAQLRAGQGDYSGALADLRKWFAKEKTPQPEANLLAGVVHANLGDSAKAIEFLERAVKAVAEPQELAMRHLLAAYLETGRDRDAVRLLQRIISRYGGGAEDWRRLSAVYRHMGDDRMALAVLMLAQRQGHLQSEADLLALVQYCLYLDLPYQAANLMSRSLRHNQLTSTRDNWELLADAWMQARETAKAIHTLGQAAAFADDPQLHLKRARFAAVAADWQQVLQAVEDALHSRSLSETGAAYLLAGMAHYNRNERSSAREAFIQAETDSATRAQARRWLDFLTRVDH